MHHALALAIACLAAAGVQCQALRHTNSHVRAHMHDAQLPPQTFGIGQAVAPFSQEERVYFNYNVSAGATRGVMTHFWLTGKQECVDNSLFSYFVDGESSASIVWNPALASGTGFSDESAPWGTKLIGKQAATGAWYNNIRIPFGKSIRVTGRTTNTSPGCNTPFYLIVRGSENIPIVVGDFELPLNARLQLQRLDNVLFQPLEQVPLARVPATHAGAVLLHTLAATSSTLDFFEGCYHLYDAAADITQNYPGMMLSTGTEDYFDGAYYFNGGTFRTELSGNTHFKKAGPVELSAYRVHDADPLFFRAGLQLVWRIGDTIDPVSGIKCTHLKGNVIGRPAPTNVTAYTFVYTWPLPTEAATAE